MTSDSYFQFENMVKYKCSQSIKREKGKQKTHSPTYNIKDNWQNVRIPRHTVDRIYRISVLSDIDVTHEKLPYISSREWYLFTQTSLLNAYECLAYCGGRYSPRYCDPFEPCLNRCELIRCILKASYYILCLFGHIKRQLWYFLFLVVPCRTCFLG